MIRARLWENDPRGLADSLTLGSTFYAQVTAQMAEKLAAKFGSEAGALDAVAEDHYRNGLF